MWDHMGQYGGWMGFGWVFMVLFWVLLVVAIVMVVKWMSAGPSAPPAAKGDTPLDILNERYARGEIDQAEYQQKKSDLKKP